MLLIVCGDVERNPGPFTNDVSCSKCNLTFSTPEKMSIHEKRVHDDRVLKCDTCKKVLIGKMKYINHQAAHKSSECKVCDLWVMVNSLKKHEKKCSGNVPEFSCELCNYKSDRKDNQN